MNKWHNDIKFEFTHIDILVRILPIYKNFIDTIMWTPPGTFIDLLSKNTEEELFSCTPGSGSRKASD